MWEYLQVIAESVTKGENDTFYSYKAHYQDNRVIRNWQEGPRLSDYLNQLGEEGWEMVGFSDFPDRNRSNLTKFIFKRPKTTSFPVPDKK